ncbi:MULTISPECIES: DUF2127 domain-containing protein [Archaeoglobus]|jgi:hypothetical protein|uniref:DUF7144 domain-containing protein n=3 Tax=Archaeoglobus fulgidus TaxID=2234 RepID=O30155_ARCFU|nr:MULTISPECIES: DUF2127 domain-containing protein [Archaeoglobus]AAB91156.1 predicted coding region AF_0081 [Archaeoglobus fulgidus DSM 4304]AIG96921.1 hypothetical protein AFULGI_00000760 [Archaeoglobus fulgidus DSM 8774]KUJ94625.1 MAG: hypothetical protein XD40_0189 [Archaeoglobus fulgidus]KUK07471.1 MAG: hypothetical protein XD48_0250 [Archaeoglobus fulgidus]MDI3497106.1 hypothetical protein [Archaeoglobus sp.]
MRPLGVTILAIVLLAIGSLAVVTGTILLSTKEESYPVFVEEYGKLLNQSLGNMPVSEEDLKTVYEMASYMAVTFGIVYLLAGFGLLTLKEWGRILTILIAGVNFVYSIFLFFIQPLAAVEIAINLLIIWYLMKPEVREKFSRKISIEERILGDQNP